MSKMRCLFKVPDRSPRIICRCGYGSRARTLLARSPVFGGRGTDGGANVRGWRSVVFPSSVCRQAIGASVPVDVLVLAKLAAGHRHTQRLSISVMQGFVETTYSKIEIGSRVLSLESRSWFCLPVIRSIVMFNIAKYIRSSGQCFRGQKIDTFRKRRCDSKIVHQPVQTRLFAHRQHSFRTM